MITGGKVVKTLEEAFVTDPNKISIVLIESKDTEDERPMGIYLSIYLLCYLNFWYVLNIQYFETDLCMQHPLVPLNMEWVLECLGGGIRKSLCNWILSQVSMLPKINWPEDLFAEDELDESSHR